MKNMVNPLICLAFTVFLFSCKKEKDPQPEPEQPSETCVVTKYTDFNETDYTIKYENGLIKSVSSSKEDQRDFTRHNDTVFIKSTHSDYAEFFDTVILNSKGMILSQYGTSINPGGTWRNRSTYKYINDQLEQYTWINGNISYSYSYIWHNGNVQSMTYGTNRTIQYSYYEDLEVSPERYQLELYMAFGGISIKNKNVLKSAKNYTSGNQLISEEEYSYTFENKKIITVQRCVLDAKGDTLDVSAASYKYDCH